MGRSKFQKQTEELLEGLKKANNLENYVLENQDEFMQVDIAEYLENIIREKQLKRSQIVKDSGLDRSYVYHILNGERKNPSRSKLLAICVAMKMDIKETQYFLRAAQVPVLYPRNQRDCIILYGLEQGRVLWNSMKRYIRCSLNCWNRIHGK
ncbi:MAG: helix-turn-helix domain-containing protein [Eubacterium sp.]